MSALRRFTVDERRARLAYRHRLLPGRRTDDVVTITRDLVGLHSSDPATVYLSAAARMVHPSLATIDQALYEDRSVVRHHAMRRTLWVFTPEMARLAHASSTTALLTPELRKFAQLIEGTGITTDGAAWIASARHDVLTALAGVGTASTRQLGDLVPALRVPIALSVGKPYEGTVAAHARLMLILGFEAAVTRVRPTGSWINSQYRWTTTDAWVPGGIVGHDPSTAAATLVDHWLRAFGPATTVDVQWWMGWTAGLTKKSLAAAGAVEVDLHGTIGWVAGDDEMGAEPAAAVPDRAAAVPAEAGVGEPWVALLPGLDPTTMGWKLRDWYLDPTLAPQLFDRNGNGGPTIWVDGRIVGGWVQRPDGHIATRLLTEVGRDVCDAIETEAERIQTLVGPARFTVRFPAPLQRSLQSDLPR